MYHHVKKLMFTVRVDEPDPRFGNMLLEQFGGANGELAAAMQYSIQGLNCEDPDRKDLLMDIGTEELSHLEIVGLSGANAPQAFKVRPRRRPKPTRSSPSQAAAGSICSIRRETHGRLIISRSPANSTLTSAATSRPKPEPRLSTSGSSTFAMIPARRMRFSS